MTTHEIQTIIEPVEGWCPPEKVWLLVEIIREYVPGSVVELGVLAGKSLCAIGLALKENTRGYAIGIDSWCIEDAAISAEEDVDKKWWKEIAESGVLETRRQQAAQLIVKLDLEGYVKLRQDNTVRASHNFDDRSIDLLHIDASKSMEGCLANVRSWLPKVTIGGLVIFDDSNWPATRIAQMRLREKCRLLVEVNMGEKGTFLVLQRER